MDFGVYQNKYHFGRLGPSWPFFCGPLPIRHVTTLTSGRWPGTQGKILSHVYFLAHLFCNKNRVCLEARGRGGGDFVIIAVAGLIFHFGHPQPNPHEFC
jgi:hypothetical protein